MLRALRELLGLGTDWLHDAGVGLSLLVLTGGLAALARRITAALRREPPLASTQVLRMLAVLGALGGFAAYLREVSYSQAGHDLTLGGLAALAWMAVVLLERLRRPPLRRGK